MKIVPWFIEILLIIVVVLCFVWELPVWYGCILAWLAGIWFKITLEYSLGEE